MKRAIFWLRVSYWTGAILDAAVGLMMLFPGLLAVIYRPADFRPGPDYHFAMGMGAPLMFGWTLLLLWADRRPLERRGILPLTVLVIAGLAANQARSAAAGFAPFGEFLPTFIIQAALVILFLFAYFKAGKAA